MKRAVFLLAMLAACGGGDFSAGVELDAAAELWPALDAQLDLAAFDAAQNETAQPEPREEAEADAATDVVVENEVHESSVADAREGGEAEAGPDPLRCRSIDGTGQCAAAGPWPFACCRSSPCECCNKPNCGTVEQ